MHPIATIHDWIVAYPVATMFIFFVLNVLLALFPKEIKLFVASWPHRLNASTRRGYENHLRRLESLHQNPYGVLLYFGYTFTDTLIFILWASMAWILVYIAIFRANIPQHLINSIGAGVFVAKMYQVRSLLKDLYNYENVTARIRAEIEKIDQDMSKKKAKEIVAS